MRKRLDGTVRGAVSNGNNTGSSVSGPQDELQRFSTVDNTNKVSCTHAEELDLRRSLSKMGRILCWVMTAEKEKRTPYRKAIMETWGKRCAKLLFVVGGTSGVSEEVADPLSGGVLLKLSMPENYQHLWQKTKLAFRHIGKHYVEQKNFDWVLKVDDDAYVIIENLQVFLRSKSPSAPHFYGCEYKASGGYNSGGPGYVISMENIPKLVKSLDEVACSKSEVGSEDLEMSKCLKAVGIHPADTRDTKGRFRFSPFNPENTIDHSTLHSRYNWFWGFTAHKLPNGLNCCADDFISFHYISPSMMYVLEYLIYYVHPFSNRDTWNERIFGESQVKLIRNASVAQP